MIPTNEFVARAESLRESMGRERLDALFVYGDEYRKENLRYVSNYWPIFERGATIVPGRGDPIVLCAPEGELVAREMSAWPDIRNVPDFACVTVPDTIDYPLATYTSFERVAGELRTRGRIERLGIVGIDAMGVPVYRALAEAFSGAEIVDANRLVQALRLIKSEHEIACLKEAARLADAGYEALMAAAVPGATEREIAAAGEGAALAAGAETIVFMVLGTGARTNTIVGRPSTKALVEGEQVMASMAVQYEGYVATVEFPFVVGGHARGDGKALIDALVEAESIGLEHLKPGEPQRELVRAVRDSFRVKGLRKYDVYPPLHGCGLAEAESPYPDENTETVFAPGMTVNTDISLFGLPVGANRIEEGFVITETGAESMSPLVRRLTGRWLAS